MHPDGFSTLPEKSATCKDDNLFTNGPLISTKKTREPNTNGLCGVPEYTLRAFTEKLPGDL